MNLLILLAGGMMLIAAFFAVEAKKLLDSVIALSSLSLLSVFLFIVMRAPDVAITEASVGAGLTTAVLLITLFKMRGDDEE
ncbi:MULTISPECIES: Na(+)/H(+) antiporter subunit B [Thermotoga]|uniref:Subunit of the Multisubunit Na+/H+ antiporter-like protein n=1 Tax=Thermotoga neapolitana (strain ATCC 49049 / DSM 4359 / NBRC 107923 / NS-E) TaxID=309803 RepID=B9K9A6_THENN|nr:MULTISPECIES: hydrogenase subunit MbhD domain-containing protein [Thermotoga]MDK2786279.1 energy-converting hydrogenase subunit [Thermotoga sp.]HBF10576.1 DUF4040 domain-containing protein [Thermotoga neapolitana]ACM23539.1 subunit of the Multisubunit Na+/H+ antiporter-like protein [Thermotoga neapolitana DSM 4359]AJG41441.1 sodium:proton antiporter [Thermotoga sp. RQ7]KFZ21167.1 subunit of the Multisubunit Na+/H+ antiporter-like protein [Thermotoga neapolitana LA10]